MSSDPTCAIHEAAHAVVGSCFGYDIRHVLLHQQARPGEEAGRCEIRGWVEEVQADPVRALMYVFAGAAAERRATGYKSSRDRADRDIAAAIASVIHDGADGADPRVLATLRTAEVLADGLMQDPAMWRRVEKVAKVLRRRHYLSGRDLQLLVREEQR